MTRSDRAVIKPIPAYKRWVTAFALLAFFLQGLAVQTHIHAPAQPPAAKTIALAHPSKTPLKAQDPVDQCRLCQELVHSGVFLAPSTAATPVSLTFTAAIFAALPAFALTTATAFAWQSRAPPRH